MINHIGLAAPFSGSEIICDDEMISNIVIPDTNLYNIIVSVGNIQIRTTSGWTGGLEPPDFVAARCRELEVAAPTFKYLPP